MKHIISFSLFENNNIFESSSIMTVGDLKIDMSNIDSDISKYLKERVSDKSRQAFKKNTGLDFSTITKDVTDFLKEQVKIINSTLYKKGINDAVFSKMMDDLITRTDDFVSKKTEDLMEKMPLGVKSTLKIVPESTLKKRMLKENSKEKGNQGLIKSFILLIGDVVSNQKVVGFKEAYLKVIDTNPAKFKISPSYEGNGNSPEKGYYQCADTILQDKNGKEVTKDGKEIRVQSFQDRQNLFWTWLDENSFDGKNLVNHYIDLVVPILA